MRSEELPRLAGVTGVILAGGLGTRLRSAVADRPKVLAEVAGRPFLSYLLDQMVEYGLREVVLLTGYLGQQIQDCFGETYQGLHLVYSQEPRPLGTAGALALARPLFRTSTAMVVNGDSFCRTDLMAFLTNHRSRPASASILLVRVPDVSRYGRVQYNNYGEVTAFEEKDGQNVPGWINAGLYLLEKPALDWLITSGAKSLELDFFPSLISQGLYGFPGQGNFIDIGTPISFAAAQDFFRTFPEHSHCPGGSSCLKIDNPIGTIMTESADGQRWPLH